MTQDEALAEVQRIISGVVLRFEEDAYRVGEDGYLVGDHNADVIIRALNSAGWLWLKQ